MVVRERAEWIFGHQLVQMRPLKWKNVLSKWEQEVQELGLNQGSPLVLWPRQALGMGVWLWLCQIHPWLGVLIKTTWRWCLQGKESTVNSAKAVKQRGLPKTKQKTQRGGGKKKANQAESPCGNGTAKPVGKGWPAWAHPSLCAALLPRIASTLAPAPVSPWWISSGMPIRGLQDCRRLTGLPAIILIFTCHRGWYSLTTFLLAPAALVGFCLKWLVRE